MTYCAVRETGSRLRLDFGGRRVPRIPRFFDAGCLRGLVNDCNCSRSSISIIASIHKNTDRQQTNSVRQEASEERDPVCAKNLLAELLLDSSIYLAPTHRDCYRPLAHAWIVSPGMALLGVAAFRPRDWFENSHDRACGIDIYSHIGRRRMQREAARVMDEILLEIIRYLSR